MVHINNTLNFENYTSFHISCGTNLSIKIKKLKMNDCRSGESDGEKQTIHSCAIYGEKYYNKNLTLLSFYFPCMCIFDARYTVFLLRRMLLPLYCSFLKSYSRDYSCQREILGEIPLGKGARLRIRNCCIVLFF